MFMFSKQSLPAFGRVAHNSDHNAIYLNNFLSRNGDAKTRDVSPASDVGDGVGGRRSRRRRRRFEESSSEPDSGNEDENPLFPQLY